MWLKKGMKKLTCRKIHASLLLCVSVCNLVKNGGILGLWVGVLFGWVNWFSVYSVWVNWFFDVSKITIPKPNNVRFNRFWVIRFRIKRFGLPV